jgi:hypothetical protein
MKSLRIRDRLQRGKAAINAPKNDGVQRMVDITAKKAEVKGKGYKKWATLHNLKQMAATISIYEESGFSSPEELEAARDGLKAQKTEKARKNYREQHESEFIIAEAATRFLRQKESKSCQRPRPYKRRLSSL